MRNMGKILITGTKYNYLKAVLCFCDSFFKWVITLHLTYWIDEHEGTRS